MEPYEVAKTGIARTFQNIALFKGMTTIENVMTGRQLQMNKNIFGKCLDMGLPLKKKFNIEKDVKRLLIFLKLIISENPGGVLTLRIAKKS